MKVEISEVEENDAIGMIELKRLLAIETKFMMRELEEVNEDLNFEIESKRKTQCTYKHYKYSDKLIS